jgi:hypothetical protein
MKIGLPAKIVFWTAICLSSLWLAVTAFAGWMVGFRVFAGIGRAPLEVLIASTFALQPFLILFLIVRAIRLRSEGRLLQIIARALLPLASALLIAGYFKAFEYLNYQTEIRMKLRRETGSFSYHCSLRHREPIEVDARVLRLIEQRHREQPSTWTVVWPGKEPISATSFQTRTWSIGGSQGIAWKASDGRSSVAYLLFSDVVSSYGPTGILVLLSQSDILESTPDLPAMHSKNFYCKPDLASYHE